jgi:hypothetical protein
VLINRAVVPSNERHCLLVQTETIHLNKNDQYSDEKAHFSVMSCNDVIHDCIRAKRQHASKRITCQARARRQDK